MISARASVGSCWAGSSTARKRTLGCAFQSAVSGWWSRCARPQRLEPDETVLFLEMGEDLRGRHRPIADEVPQQRCEPFRLLALVGEVRLAERCAQERVVAPGEEVQRLPHHGRLDNRAPAKLALEALAAKARRARPDPDVRPRRCLRLHAHEPLDDGLR
jgi:hypothetical protein